MSASARTRVIPSLRVRRVAGVIGLTSAVSLAACATSSHFETTGAGHPISATVTGAHTIESHPTHATIATRAGVVTVEGTRARIDSGVWQAIPESVPVQVTMSTHTVSIRAGAVTISRTVR